MEEFIEKGTQPIFGYPPICFSPVHADPREHVENGNRNISVLMKHVFTKNTNETSVSELIEANRNEQKWLDTV